MSTRMPFPAALLLSLLAPWPATGLAHGVSLEIGTATEFRILARFENGSPMAGAQVVVYGPQDPRSPLETGVADAEGIYRFQPDPALPGEWTVQVRQAGHGAVAYLQVEADGLGTVRANATVTPLQRALFIGAVLWGILGTVLFFRRRQPARAHP
jgi:nickel transport protein